MWARADDSEVVAMTAVDKNDLLNCTGILS